MITLWRGSANTWDCDEMGHMNVRVYVEKAMEGLGRFAAAIHMPHAYRENAPSTLIPAQQHVRFIREVQPGRPLVMTGCVIEWDETSVLVYQELCHNDGTPAAALRTRLIHAETKSGQAFGWSSKSRAALDELIAMPPAATAPRGVDLAIAPLPADQTTLANALKVGAPEIGCGLVPPQHCDINGRMQAAWFMGRLSDSVPNLLYDWRKQVAAAADGARMGAAVLEHRLIYRRWPRAGDRFVIHSSLANVSEKTHSLVHWILDPDTGEAWVTSEALAVTFDLDSRKVLPTPGEQIQKLETLAPRGLAL